MSVGKKARDYFTVLLLRMHVFYLVLINGGKRDRIYLLLHPFW